MNSLSIMKTAVHPDGSSRVPNEMLKVTLIATLVSLLAFLIYVVSGNYAYPSGDTIPNALLPFSMLHYHDFLLGRYIDIQPTTAIPYFLHPYNGDFVSYQPGLGSSLTALPVFALYALSGAPMNYVTGAVMGKFAASAICALSVGITYITLRKLSIKEPISVGFTILYAVGSETFAVSSQGLWRHGPAELWLSIFLLSCIHIIKEPTKSRIAAQCAGLSMGMLFLVRPQNILLVLPFVFLAVKKEYRRPIVYSLPLLLVSVGLYEWYDKTFFHATPVVSDIGETGRLDGGFLSGFLGNMFSPSRGLLVFMPWTLFSLLYIRFVRRPGPWRAFYALTFVSVLLYIVVYSKLAYWPAGNSFGPRYMTDMLPMLTVLAAGYLNTYVAFISSKLMLRVQRIVLAIFSLWSIGIQFLGADVPSGMAWNNAVHPDYFHRPMWFVRNGEIPFYLDMLQAQSKPPSIIEHPKAVFERFDLQGITLRDAQSVILRPQSTYSGTVQITNRGTGTWSAYPSGNGKGAVELVYTVYQDGKKVDVPSVVPNLFYQNVAPGQSTMVYFTINTPQQPGQYTYVFTLEQKGYGRFATELGGNNELQVPIQVATR